MASNGSWGRGLVVLHRSSAELEGKGREPGVFPNFFGPPRTILRSGCQTFSLPRRNSPFLPHGSVNCFRMTWETTCWSGSFCPASGISALIRRKISWFDGISPKGAAPTATVLTCYRRSGRSARGGLVRVSQADHGLHTDEAIGQREQQRQDKPAQEAV